MYTLIIDIKRQEMDFNFYKLSRTDTTCHHF